MQATTGLCSDDYWSGVERLLSVVGPRRDKSCGRVADKFGLRMALISTYVDIWIYVPGL